MKAIIKDYLRRWKWVFILTAVLQFPSLFAPPSHLAFTLFTVVYGGAMLLSFDLVRGTPRVCRSLPVTQRDLAKSWAFVSIVAPLALFVTNVILVTAIRGVFGISGSISLSQATFLIAVAFLWLGLSFHLLTHLPSANLAHDPAHKTKNTIFGGLWGLCLGGGFFVLMKMPNRWESLQPWHWIALAGALVSTGLGWRRAEEMVINRASPARTGEDVELRLAREKKGAGAIRREGLPFMFRVVTSNAVKTTLIFTFIFIGFQIYLRNAQQGDWLTAAAQVVQEPSTFYILIPLVMIAGLQWLAGIRHLRTLPLKGSFLTLLICGFFILPTVVMLAVMGLLQLTLGSSGLTAEWLSLTCLMTTPILLVPGLLLHFGLNWKSYFLVITPVFVAAPLIGLVLTYISGPWRVLICVLAWGVGALLIHRSITRRSQTYRYSLSWPMRPA